MKKKALLMAAAIVAAVPAWAEWTLFANDVDGKWFAEPSSLRFVGSSRQVWLLEDMVAPDKSGVRSIKALVEIDCPQGRARYLQWQSHKASMGQGQVHAADTDPTAWAFVPPDSIISKLVKAACSATKK